MDESAASRISMAPDQVLAQQDPDGGENTFLSDLTG
jgi:hypothetical protein